MKTKLLTLFALLAIAAIAAIALKQGINKNA